MCMQLEGTRRQATLLEGTRRQLRSLMNLYFKSNLITTIIALSKEVICNFERDDLLNYTAFNGHFTPRSVRRQLATIFKLGQDLE